MADAVVVSSYPSAYTTDDWSNPTYAYADDANWASIVIADGTTHYPLYLEDFGIPALLPSGAVVSQVELEAEYKTSSSYDDAYFGMVAFLSGTIEGADVIGNEQNATTITKTYTSGDILDTDNLTDALFKVRVSAWRTSGGRWIYCNYVKVSVTYTPSDSAPYAMLMHPF